MQDLAAAGFPLVGSRMDYVSYERVAVLTYRHGQHLIDFYLAEVTHRDLAQRPAQIRGYWIAATQVQDQTAWIVTDINEQDLQRFRRLLGATEAAPSR